MSFEAAIRAFEAKAKKAMNDSVCKAFEYLATENVRLTTEMKVGGYSVGHIANNWRVSVGSPQVLDDGTADITGGASLSRIKAFTQGLHFLGKDNTIFLTNGVNYSYRANVLGWPAGQGTNGWHWTGNVKAYGFTTTAINNLKGKYT